jgi:hypothetical protein
LIARRGSAAIGQRGDKQKKTGGAPHAQRGPLADATRVARPGAGGHLIIQIKRGRTHSRNSAGPPFARPATWLLHGRNMPRELETKVNDRRLFPDMVKNALCARRSGEA